MSRRPSGRILKPLAFLERCLTFAITIAIKSSRELRKLQLRRREGTAR